jgi:putative DNA methylase
MSKKNVVPFSLRDAPALIEKLFPAQKLSAEAFKEREGRQGQTLTGLGSYWKGRKPLILNKGCILGALLPVTKNLKRDLEVFEMLMAMDDASFLERWGVPTPTHIVETLTLPNLFDYFTVTPNKGIPGITPLKLAEYADADGVVSEVRWRDGVDTETQQRLELEAIAHVPYRARVDESKRPEQLGDTIYAHVWEAVNEHLGTHATSFPELTEQLGVMRFGQRPRVADTFCGSGQIPFEAARLGCDAFAADLNPVACMLTWGAFHVVGAKAAERKHLEQAQAQLADKIRTEIDALDIETDGRGARAKVFLYCIEATCPETGWIVPLLPTLVVSKGYETIAELVPDQKHKRYDIKVRRATSSKELAAAVITGTLQDGAMVHSVKGKTYRTKISTLRGDYVGRDGANKNKLRRWEKSDFMFRPTDIFRERLYAVQWQKVIKVNGKDKVVAEFRAVTPDDLKREQKAVDYVAKHLAEWQAKGIVPDMAIERGDKTDEPIRTRGWTYWHHLFNPRQLLTAALLNREPHAGLKFGLTQVLNLSSRLSRFAEGGAPATKGVFDNQALNTLFTYGCRGFVGIESLLTADYRSFPLPAVTTTVSNIPASEHVEVSDIYVTDPPFGDAVKYEEILEFFIAWLRKNPPKEFADWVWDSRRALAIKGEDDDFRKGMIAAYRRATEKMPDNGIQIIMFTHQSGSIWADMANIVWASGLHVTAAWYVVTETDSALREGSYVKGTVLLVLRKRLGSLKTNRGDLGWELEDEVKQQVQTLTGLNQETRDLYRDESLFSDADLQMAGYAAALRVLTKYSVIDGRDMAEEAQRPRVKGQTTVVDELIEFAVGAANQALVPVGIKESSWALLQPAERFYLKMLDLESHGAKTLDNYQNFAKAFKVKDFKSFLGSDRANATRLKSADEFGRTETGESSELYNTPLRALLYALMELQNGHDTDETLIHIPHNLPDYYNQREIVIELSDYLAKRLVSIRPEEASAARVLRDLVRNQRVG